jgi:site-specific DNA-methyltransferase (adenine-specific)
MDITKLIHGDCLDEIFLLPKHSVDLILTDLPYGVTQNHWDTILPLDVMWEAFKHILKLDGRVVLTATQPFTSKLIISNLKEFKYDLIWEKSISSGQLNVSKMPMRSHEHILVFYDKFNTYNEQKTSGLPYSIDRKKSYIDGCYNKQKTSQKTNTGYRHARSVIKISNPRVAGGLPTQKPVELMSYLVKTFSNENDVVLDCCMGTGTTGAACIKNNRAFIGIELNKNYFDVAEERLIKLLK